MDDFFSHPDQMGMSDLQFDQSSQQHLGYNFGVGGKVDGNAMATNDIAGGMGNAMNSGVGGGRANSTYQVNSQVPRVQANALVSHQSNPNNTYANNNDDAWAGAALMGMYSNAQQPAAQDGSNQNTASSWGGLGMFGIQQPRTPESPTSSRQSASSPTEQLAALPVNALYDSMHYREGNAPPAGGTGGGNGRRRNFDLNAHAQFGGNWMYSSGLSAQNFLRNLDHPAQFGFGTDANFSGHRFSAPGFVAGAYGKERNLMGVPLAEKAAHAPSGRQNSHPTSQRTFLVNDAHSSTSSPGAQVGGLPISNTNIPNQNQTQWATIQAGHMRRNDNNDQGEPSRKRRKSNLDGDREEYVPDYVVQGSIPRRGPKVPKAEGAISDEYEPHMLVNSKTSALKRRRSTVEEAEEPSASRSPSEGASPGASSSRRKARDGKSRTNLTEDQKRQNHILSEQKRRNLIKNSFTELNELVPCLKGGKSGLSKADIILEIVKHLDSLVTGNEVTAREFGVNPEDLSKPSPSDGVNAY